MCQIEAFHKKAFPPAAAVRSLALLSQVSLCEASLAHAFGKPRSLLPLHAFIAGLTNSAFLFLLCIVERSLHFISSAIPTIAIPLACPACSEPAEPSRRVTPHITGDGFDLLILFVFCFEF
jgi:hypothetical protein